MEFLQKSHTELAGYGIEGVQKIVSAIGYLFQLSAKYE